MPTNLPIEPSQISSAWLTNVFEREGFGFGRVVKVDVEMFPDGLSLTGKLARIRPQYEKQGEGPATLIAKMPDPTQLSPVVRSAFQREITFYRELGQNVGARVPVMYHGDVYEDSAAILLEDLSPAVPGDSTEGCSLEDAMAAVRALASIHAHWWQNSRIANFDWLWKPRGNNDHLQAARLIDKGWSMAPSEFRQVLPTAVARLCSEGLWSAKITRKLEERPNTLTHPDFRLDNIFFDRRTSPAQVAVIDWGRVTFAPVAQSLAYLLGRESGLPASDIETCLDHYQTEMTRLGVADYTPEQCRIDFRLGVLQVLTVSLWQFHSGANRKVDERILEMRRQGWERVNQVLMDFDCLRTVEE